MATHGLLVSAHFQEAGTEAWGSAGSGMRRGVNPWESQRNGGGGMCVLCSQRGAAEADSLLGRMESCRGGGPSWKMGLLHQQPPSPGQGPHPLSLCLSPPRTGVRVVISWGHLHLTWPWTQRVLAGPRVMAPCLPFQTQQKTLSSSSRKNSVSSSHTARGPSGHGAGPWGGSGQRTEPGMGGCGRQTHSCGEGRVSEEASPVGGLDKQ